MRNVPQGNRIQKVKYIAVFCGSNPGNAWIHADQAEALGRAMAERGLGLIYGGTQVGLMGIVANACLASGGAVIGVIPEFLKDKEFAHKGLTELVVVKNLHERKRRMNERCDGVIALPGGYGTMDELFEMLARVQLGLFRKPVGVFNINGFYDPLCQLTKNMVEQGFLKSDHQRILTIEREITPLLDFIIGG